MKMATDWGKTNPLDYCFTIIYSESMIIKPNRTDPWTETATRAAAEAKYLRPIAQALLILAILMIVSQYFAQPAWEEIRRAPTPSFLDALNQWLLKIINAGSAVALTWALWETQGYLKKLKQGAIWSVSTMQFFGRIGECLIASAVWATLISPTITGWATEFRGGFQWHLESQSLVLLGLGLLMSLLARVIGTAFQTANDLKADHDGII